MVLLLLLQLIIALGRVPAGDGDAALLAAGVLQLAFR